MLVPHNFIGKYNDTLDRGIVVAPGIATHDNVPKVVIVNQEIPARNTKRPSGGPLGGE
jgi:hypothetical protein